MRRLTIILAFFALLGGSVLAQPESAPAPTTRQRNKAELVAEKIEKQVEKVRGITLKSPVKIGVYDAATLKAFLLKSAEKDLSPEKLDPQVRSLKAFDLVPRDFDYKKVLLEMLNEQIAGFYDPETKELRLIDRAAPGADAKKPTGTDQMAGLMKMIGVDLDSFIMAHELTHALQDEFVGLKNLPIESSDSDDMAMASKALVEGDATVSMMAWLMNKAGQSPKMIFSRDMASQFDRAGGDLAGIPGAEAVSNAPEVMKQALIFPYIGGFKFCIEITFKEKNFAAIDKALKSPPLSTEQIIHPEKYSGEQPDFPMSITLPDVSEIVGMTKLATNDLGELGTRILLAEKLEKAVAWKRAEGWDGDRYAIYAGKAGEPDLLVWLSTWDRPEDADDFERALGSWLAALNPGATSEPSDVTSARFVRKDGTLDAIARKGSDVILVRAIPKEKLIPVLQKMFEETKKVERRKV